MRKLKTYIFIILNAGIWAVTTAKSGPKEGEIETELQFLEYELKDYCQLKNEAIWGFSNGTLSNLNRLLSAEINESNFYKNEVNILQKYSGKKFSSQRLSRLMELFTHPGAPLLGNSEFREYREYSVKLEELIGTLSLSCQAKGNDSSTEEITFEYDNEFFCPSIGHNEMNQLLYKESNMDKLKEAWIKWYKQLRYRNSKLNNDFLQQLSILGLEAELNGEDELSNYWLKQSDVTRLNYDTAKSLWNEIQPLYEKMKKYMIALIVQNFGKEVFHEAEIIPAHILGSLKSYDWVTAAEKLKAFENSNFYKSINSFLKAKTFNEIYKMADSLSAELKIGNLPEVFYEKSRFNESSRTCSHKLMDYCDREYKHRVMVCANKEPDIMDYIVANENVMRMKYLLWSGKEDDVGNGFLFREGPRDSVLFEATENYASLRALLPNNLKSQKLLLSNQTYEKEEISSLFITALHIIPPMAYYLSSDLWRLKALQEIDSSGEENATETTTVISSTYKDEHKIERRQADGENKIDGKDTTENGTAVSETSQSNSSREETVPSKPYRTEDLNEEWWKFRKQYQGIGSPDGKIYEDYLLDERIIWNRPYLSKFLGRIFLFQMMDYLKTENIKDDNLPFLSLMRRGKSSSWENLTEEAFNITVISAKPLLNYFKPLEEYLDKGILYKNETKLFSFDDSNFLSQGFSLNPKNNQDDGLKPAEGSDALFFSLAVTAAVGVVAVIITIGRRRYKKRQRARQRKRKEEELEHL